MVEIDALEEYLKNSRFSAANKAALLEFFEVVNQPQAGPFLTLVMQSPMSSGKTLFCRWLIKNLSKDCVVTPPPGAWFENGWGLITRGAGENQTSLYIIDNADGKDITVSALGGDAANVLLLCSEFSRSFPAIDDGRPRFIYSPGGWEA